ncbi:MAG: hypothetical protein ACTHLD_19430 [Chitinophaga sp.]
MSPHTTFIDLHFNISFFYIRVTNTTFINLHFNANFTKTKHQAWRRLERPAPA